jgi:hypothetical protein
VLYQWLTRSFDHGRRVQELLDERKHLIAKVQSLKLLDAHLRLEAEQLNAQWRAAFVDQS